VARAVGVEKEEKLADSINAQAKRFLVGDRLNCLCDDVFVSLAGESFLETLPKDSGRESQFDILMIAPPQYVGLIDKTLIALSKGSLVSEEGLILCQHDTKETGRIDFSPYKVAQQRKYGNTTFTVLRAT